MLKFLGWIILLHAVQVLSAGMPWSSSSQLTRVPGLRPYNSRIAFPQFLAMGMNSDSSNSDLGCERISPGCPNTCIQIDKTGCAVCTCSSQSRGSEGCPRPPNNCPSSCRRRERGCNVCKCDDSQHSGSNPSLSTSHVATKCFSMVMCMLTCKTGYKLGEVIDRKGCQTCRCIGGQGQMDGSKTGTGSGHTGGHSQSIGSSTGQHSDNTDWSSGAGTNSGDWGSMGSIPGSSSGSNSGQTWSSGSSTGMTGGSPDWENISQGVGNEGDSCSGPMCPGASSSGMNPMNPGAGLGMSGDSGSGCTGPFCGGTGSGGSETSSGGDSGCTGPFCISGGMGSGSDGAGMGGGMMGGASGGAGMGGGMMGRAGGSGAFSPFGLAAAGGGSSNNGGGASGCNGPFCTMTSAGMGGPMKEEYQSGGGDGCEGPACSAHDGYS